MDAGGDYCVITVLWIFTTWRKVANKIVKINGWVIKPNISIIKHSDVHICIYLWAFNLQLTADAHEAAATMI